MSKLLKFSLIFFILCFFGKENFSQRTRILIKDTKDNYDLYYYRKHSGILEGGLDAIKTAVKKAFPCAYVFTVEEIRKQIKQDQIETLNGRAPDSQLNDIMAGYASVDYILTSSIGYVGKSSYLTLTLIDIRHSKVSGDGQAWIEGLENVYNQLIEKAMKDLAQVPVCPWEGNITVTMQKKYDTSYRNSYGSSELTTTEEYSKKSEFSESADLTIKGKGYGSNRSQGTGSLKASSNFTSELRTEESGKEYKCFKPNGPCAIIADNWTLGGSGVVETIEAGKTKFSQGLNNIEVDVKFIDDKNYTLTLKAKDPLDIGTGEYTTKESSKTSCGGECTRPPVTAHIPAEVVPIDFMITYEGTPTDRELKGSKTFQLGNEGNIGEANSSNPKPIKGALTITVNWNLKK